MAIVTAAEAESWCNATAGDSIIASLLTYAQRAVERFVGWELERANYTRFYPRAEPGGSKDTYFPGDWGGVSNTGGRTGRLFLDHKYVLASGFQIWEYSGAYHGQVGTFGTTNLLTLGTHYALDLLRTELSRSGMVIRLGGDWPKTSGSIKVTYTAGFSATELSGAMSAATDYTNASDVKFAVLETIQKCYGEVLANQKDSGTGQAGPFSSESVAGAYGYTLDSALVAALRGMVWDIPRSAAIKLERYRKYTLAI